MSVGTDTDTAAAGVRIVCPSRGDGMGGCLEDLTGPIIAASL